MQYPLNLTNDFTVKNFDLFTEKLRNIHSCMRESPALARHISIFVFLHSCSSSFLHLNYWVKVYFLGHITILQQLDFSFKFYERRMLWKKMNMKKKNYIYEIIIMCLIVNVAVITNLIYKSFHHLRILLLTNFGTTNPSALIYVTKIEFSTWNSKQPYC